MNPLFSRLFGQTKTKPKGGVSTIDDPTLGAITINHSARARRIAITVKQSGEVRLTVPLNVDPKLAIQFLTERREWIVNAQQRVRQNHTPKPQYTPTQINELRQRAKEYLPTRCQMLASQHGLTFNRLTIRASRSRWGSCSGQNNISLSLFLMTLPPHLIDFVILHELVHTVHHNHSPQFHSHLNSLLNNQEQVLILELRRWGV